MIKAVIFDLDGLLVDSEPVWFKVRKSFMQQFNLEWTVEDHIKQMGVSTESWANYTYDKIGGKLERERIIDEILNRMISNYENGEVNILTGANTALKYCSENYITGLASGSPLRLINAAIKGAGWSQYFSKVISSDEVDNGKPAPDTYLEIFNRLDILPEETVVVEDSGGGIMAGLNSGAKVIAVPNPELLPSVDILSKADMRLESLLDVPMALDRLGKVN